MIDTPVSLLERLRLRADEASWQRLMDLYTPLIRDWLAAYTLQAADRDDLCQEVLQVVVRALPDFQHDLRRGAFRRWLRTILVNEMRRFWRGQKVRPRAAGDNEFEAMLSQLEDSHSSLAQLWDQEHDRFVVRRLLELIRPEFEETSWQAFQLLVMESLPTKDIAARLGISSNAVRIAKSRILSRLRDEIAGLVD